MTRLPSEPNQGRFTIVHSLPHRLRLRSNLLRDPALDTDYIVALLESLSGVERARINRAAASIVVEFREKTLRNQILLTLNNLPEEAFLPDIFQENNLDTMDVGGHIAAAALTPVLPLPVKIGMSWLLALPTLINGMQTLVDRGLKIEVLDGTVKLLSLLRGDYFTSNTVGALLKLGAYVEQSTENKTTDLLKNLLQPQVEDIRVERDGAEVRIPFAEVSVDERVICGPGELLPVDGEVLSGEASVNMSSVTGESVPVHIQPGDSILSGGIIEDGRVVIRARMVRCGNQHGPYFQLSEKIPARQIPFPETDRGTGRQTGSPDLWSRAWAVRPDGGCGPGRIRTDRGLFLRHQAFRARGRSLRHVRGRT